MANIKGYRDQLLHVSAGVGVIVAIGGVGGSQRRDLALTDREPEFGFMY